MTANELPPYEREALKEIHEWKNPKLGWFGWAMQTINWPINKAGELVASTPGVDWILEKSIGGLVGVLNDAAQYTVRPEAIREDFRKAGHAVHTQDDIYGLGLEEVDRVIGWLGMKYKGLALAEGGATGAVGLPGIPVNIVALITLSLRAVGEYATHCGFDVSLQQERLFALNVLGLASSSSDAAKQVAMAQLVRIASDVAKKKAWRDLERHAFVTALQALARQLGIRLTKAKLAQIIPALGGAIGAGFDTYYISRVCDAAYFLYRERFLARKYGPDVIEQTVEPADSFEVPEEPLE